MGKDSPAPPPAPDYTGAAKAQGAANVTSAQQTGLIGNPNVNSPYGNQQVSYSPYGGSDPNNASLLIPTLNQTLNPQSQQIFDAQQASKLGLANLSGNALTTAQGVMNSPFQYNGAPMQTSLGTPGALNYGPSAGQYGLASGNIDLSGVANMPVNAGQTGQQAIMARLQPQIQQGDTAYASQLANQGIGLGSQAYDQGMRVHNQSNNDLLSQAALQGIGLDMSANQQGFNQAMQRGQFGNQAIAQNFGQGMSAAGFQNQAQNQQYNQGLMSAQFGNTAQQQALQQQLYQRELPLNEISALMSGSQIQNPQFQAYQGGQVAPAPLYNATNAQYMGGLQGYGMQNASNNSFNSGLMSMAGTALGGYFGGPVGAAAGNKVGQWISQG